MGSPVARLRAGATVAVTSAALVVGVLVPGVASPAAADGYDKTFSVACGDTQGLIAAFKEITGTALTDQNRDRIGLLGSPKSFRVVLASNCTYAFSSAYDGANALPVIGGDILNKSTFDYNIVESVTLDGNGSRFVRTGGSPFRFLAVRKSSASLTVNDLTFSGGQAPDGTHVANHEWWKFAISISVQVIAAIATAGASSWMQGALKISVSLPAIVKVASGLNTLRKGVMATVNDVGAVTPGGNGGAVASDGSLTLNRVTFQNNRAGDGGNGADGTAQDGAGGGSGGAVYVSPTGNLQVQDSVFTGNRAGAGGVGAYGWTPFTGGAGRGGAGGDGGAIASYGPTTVTGSRLASNLAGMSGPPGKDWGFTGSGGPYGDGAALMLGPSGGDGSTVTARISSSVFDSNGNLAGRGGAVAAAMSAQVLVENSTFIYNRASYGGTFAALDTYASSGANGNSIDVRNSVFDATISDNDGTLAYAADGNKISLANSVLLPARSTSTNSPCRVGGSGTITTHTLFTAQPNDPECAGRQEAAARMLPDTAGPIGTMKARAAFFPVPDSVLVDAGDPAYCPALDQRGVSRAAGACDVGTIDHFEWDAASLGTLYRGEMPNGTWDWSGTYSTAQLLSKGWLYPVGTAQTRVLSGTDKTYFFFPEKITRPGVRYVFREYSVANGWVEHTTDHDGNPITDPSRVGFTFPTYGYRQFELWLVSSDGQRVRLNSRTVMVYNDRNTAPEVSLSARSESTVDQYTTKHYTGTVTDPDVGAQWWLEPEPDCGANATMINLVSEGQTFEFDCFFGAGTSTAPYPSTTVSVTVRDEQGASATATPHEERIRFTAPQMLRGPSANIRDVPYRGQPQVVTYTLTGDPHALADLASDPVTIGTQHCGDYLAGPRNATATVEGTTLTGSFECAAEDPAGIGKRVTGSGGSFFSLEKGARSGPMPVTDYRILGLADVSADAYKGIIGLNDDGRDNLTVSLNRLNSFSADDVSFTSIDWGDGSTETRRQGWAPGAYGHRYTTSGAFTATAYAYVNSLGQNVPIWSTTVYTSDRSAPVITTPGDLTLTNANAASATVHYQATATDPFLGTRTIGCSVADGTVMPVGVTTVTCTADNGRASAVSSDGTRATASFRVTVNDVVAPEIGTPTVQQTAADDGTRVDFSLPITDASPTTTTCDHPSGSVFLGGLTTVACTVTDSAGNVAATSFLVNVGTGEAPRLTVPELVTATSATGRGAAVAYEVSAADERGTSLTPTCAPTSGSVLPAGSSIVTCTVSDGNGNWNTASFPVWIYGEAPTNWNDLQASFERGGTTSQGKRSQVVQLGSDLSSYSSSDGTGSGLKLVPGDDVTLDLAGHALSIDAPAGAAAIGVPAGAKVTIIDSSSAKSGSLTLRAQGGGAALGGSVCQSAGAIVIAAGVRGTAISAGGDALGGGAAIGAGAALTPEVAARWHLDAANVHCDSPLSGGTVSFVGSAYGDRSPSSGGSSAGSTGSAPGASISWNAPAAGQSRTAVWAIAPNDTGDDGGIGFGPSGWLNVHLEGGDSAEVLGGPLAVPSQLVFTKNSRNVADLRDAETNPGSDDPTRSGQLFGGWRAGSVTGSAWSYDRASAASDPVSKRDLDVYASWLPVTGDASTAQVLLDPQTDTVLDLRGRTLSLNWAGGTDGPGVTLPPTAKLTVADTVGSGALMAGGGAGAAGIGGSAQQGAGTLVVDGGRVMARGHGGAGVGGGAEAAGGIVDLRGGFLRAQSFPTTIDGVDVDQGAAVGAGAGANPGSGGVITATAAIYDSGDGGGLPADGGGDSALAAAFSRTDGAPAMTGESRDDAGEASFVASFGFAVTFHLDGGRVPAGAAPYEIDDGTVILARPRGGDLSWMADSAPEKSGRSFQGWYADSALQTPVDLTHTVLTAPVDLYAKWGDAPLQLMPDGGDPTVNGTPTRVTGALQVNVPTSWNGGDVTPEVHYQWLRNGVPIRDAADQATYTTQLRDVGRLAGVRVTATAPGYAPYEWSTDTSTVAPAQITLDTTGESIYGAGWAYPVAGTALTLENFGWSSFDGTAKTPMTPASVTYTWLRDGAPIAGAPSLPSYTPGADDLGAVVSVRVTATQPGYEPETREFGNGTLVSARVFPTLAAPTLTQRCAEVGGACILTPVVTRFGDIPGLQLTYRWYVGTAGQPYTEVTGNGTFTSPASDPYRQMPMTVDYRQIPPGSSVQVSVTATAPGYAPVTAQSSLTAAFIDGKRFTKVVGVEITNLTRATTTSPRPGDLLASSLSWTSPRWEPWTSSAGFAYLWEVTDDSGTRVVSTNPSVRFDPAWGGKRLVLTVTGEADGFYSQKVSASTGLPAVVTVHFDSAGGNAVADAGALQGQTFPRPADPVRPGYAFAGWFQGAQPWEFAFAALQETTLTAHWTPLAATVDSWDMLVTKAAAARTDGTTTALTVYADLSADDSSSEFVVPPGASIALDLHGRQITVSRTEGTAAGLTVGLGAALAVDDSVGGGSLTASTSAGGAGIGGRTGQDAGSVTILRATVSATGGRGAGIGGGVGGDGGTVSIRGGSVVASSASGASIGAGEAGSAAGTLSIAGTAVRSGAIARADGGAPTPELRVTGTPAGSYASFAVTSDLTPAEWGGGSYTTVDYGIPVHVDLDGDGSYGSIALPGSPFFLGTDPSREGSAFAGWFSDAARTTPLSVDRDADGNGTLALEAETTVYAKWMPLPDVVVDGGAGDCGRSTAQGIALGQLLCASVPGHRVALAGYVDGTAVWTLDGAPVTFQWYRAGQPVDAAGSTGAHSAMYRVTSADLDQPLSVRMDVAPAGAPAYTGTSPERTVRAAAAASAPQIAGRAYVGETLTVDNGTWTTPPRQFAYAWFRDGVAVDGATGASYRLTSADGGHTVTARVTWTGSAGSPVEAMAAGVSVPVPLIAVTFDSAGGSAVPSVQLAPGGILTAPTAPTRAGHDFAGWYAGDAAFDFSSAVPADLTLTAHWTVQRVTVTFDANGGAGSVAPETADVGSPTALSAAAFTRSHYTFTGWNTAADGSGTAYADGATYPFAAAATLYAQWTAATYTVTFDANGGLGAISAQSKTYDGQPAALAANVLTRANHAFAGWNTARDGSGTAYPDASPYAFDASTTLYAQWTATGCATGSWTATYYSGTTMQGAPIAAQCLSVLRESFAAGQSPLPAVPSTKYSARFVRTLDEGAGTYSFSVFADNGARVLIDGVTVISSWESSSGSWRSATVPLSAGPHRIEVEYFQGTGGAKVVLEYKQVPPAPCASSAWSATYFAGTTPTGTPLATQCLSTLREIFAAGTSPLPQVPSTRYSARFSRTLDEGAGSYTFSIYHDNGARVFVDGREIISAWSSTGQWDRATIPLTDGRHDIVVEYYQGTGGAKVVFEHSRRPR